jgi:hypothetical protein
MRYDGRMDRDREAEGQRDGETREADKRVKETKEAKRRRRERHTASRRNTVNDGNSVNTPEADDDVEARRVQRD